jgi:hypothetical protein
VNRHELSDTTRCGGAITVTYPAPMYSLPTSTTLAAFTIASAASTDPMSPLVSTIPSASEDM